MRTSIKLGAIQFVSGLHTLSVVVAVAWIAGAVLAVSVLRKASADNNAPTASHPEHLQAIHLSASTSFP
jgi:hypothetical protein